MHMVCSFTDCAVDRVMIAGELFTFCALLAVAGQFAASADLDKDKFPPLIEDSLDTLRDIDDSVDRNNFVVAVHISIVQFVEPERILLTPVRVHIGDIRQMLYVTFPSNRSKRTGIRMHRGEHDSGILNTPKDIFGSKVPMDPHATN